MNGIHDMAGMQDMGPIQYEKSEPVFHERWEARTFALVRGIAAWRKWSIDAARYQRELIPPVEYLRMSYYERWLAGLVELMVKTNLVTQAEIDSGKPAPGSPKSVPPITADKVLPWIARGTPFNRDAPSVARFTAGQPVRARNMNPVTHTRLPRYARGKSGTVVRDYGVFVFPDTSAVFLGESPQHLYSVRFSAREFWGHQAAPQDTVYIDLWDAYLEPA
ncbi:MAG: nitrile hydratase subunit beta [Steroidobacteraceae bacterium]